MPFTPEPVFDHTGRGHLPTRLTRADLERSLAEGTAEGHRRIAELNREQAEQAAAQVRLARERGQQELADFEARSEAAWLAAGGDRAGFARNWPQLRDDY